MQFNPVLNTSIRGHGKWGDFLVALIPLSWCGNILINSNFILRMIEWQNESSLFTIRVQGKQWYWVYKYDASAAQSILAAPKNIGHDRWFISTPMESYCADTYYQALQLGAQLEFTQLYQKLVADAQLSKESININTLPAQAVSITDSDKLLTLYKNNNGISHSELEEVRRAVALARLPLFISGLRQFNEASASNYSGDVWGKNLYSFYTKGKKRESFLSIYRFENSNFLKSFTKNSKKVLAETVYYAETEEFKSLNKFYITLVDIIDRAREKSQYNGGGRTALAGHHQFDILEDTQNFAANRIETSATKVMSIQGGVLNEQNLNTLLGSTSDKLKKLILFIPKFSSAADNVTTKSTSEELLWGFKQKKYKRLQKFYFTSGATYDPKTLNIVNTNKPKNSPLMLKSQLITPFKQIKYALEQPDNFNYQKAVKYNRHRSELVPVTLARRLLRTKRTLVLPAHTNITVITNSYDVVHSWFIPGLGIKLDCVPGRSTHHSFYIDNVGFYYGQCAEICGRYHHHMPIRLCALPFEQFLVWWQKKGLKRMHRVNTIKATENLDSNLIKFRYSW